MQNSEGTRDAWDSPDEAHDSGNESWKPSESQEERRGPWQFLTQDDRQSTDPGPRNFINGLEVSTSSQTSQPHYPTLTGVDFSNGSKDSGNHGGITFGISANEDTADNDTKPIKPVKDGLTRGEGKGEQPATKGSKRGGNGDNQGIHGAGLFRGVGRDETKQ